MLSIGIYRLHPTPSITAIPTYFTQIWVHRNYTL